MVSDCSKKVMKQELIGFEFNHNPGKTLVLIWKNDTFELSWHFSVSVSKHSMSFQKAQTIWNKSPDTSPFFAEPLCLNTSNHAQMSHLSGVATKET